MKSGDEIGPYRVVRLLGQGGMGAVYEVEHRDLGVRYALKVFTCERSTNAFLRKRFLTEGKLLARLNHPRIVRVFDLAVDSAQGVPYFVMNLVLAPDGRPRTLEDLRKAGDVTEEQAAVWYADLAEGLAYVHANGVVHRDVKLENVLVDAEGHAVLTDFGVSRIFEEKLRRDLRTTVTMVGMPGLDDRLIMGTKVYLAPEIRFGEKATPASDWYALGVLMLRLLTGVWFGPGTDVAGLLAGFDINWKTRLVPLLAIDPSQRHPYLPSQGVRVSGGGPKSGPRRPVWLWAASAAVVLAGLSVLTFFEFRKPAPTEGESDFASAVRSPDPTPETLAAPESIAVASASASDEEPAEPPDDVSVPSLHTKRPAATERPAAATDFADAPTALVLSDTKPIPNFAFAGQTGLQSVTLPEGIPSIGDGAFAGCTGLRYVTIPSSVDSIGRLAFAACDKLEAVEFKGPTLDVDANGQTFPNGVLGLYPARWADDWRRVIDPETGMWMGLFMLENP